MKKYVLICFIAIASSLASNAQHSIARQWNEVLLESIRNDEARPTIHARNLFHVSAAMYDVWAIYEGTAETYFMGKTVNGYRSFFEGFRYSGDLESARHESISYAVYRILLHRFVTSERKDAIYKDVNDFMNELGYDPNFDSYDYKSGSPAALGNYVARCIINYGMQDGSNEIGNYASESYTPVNEPSRSGTSFTPPSENFDPNHWQPITFGIFVSQSGIASRGATPEFITPDWGMVNPFSLSKENLSIFKKEETDYWVYHDPGPPPYLDATTESEEYKWGFSMVISWTSHLDTNDGVLWDISPKSIGNIASLPESSDEYPTFYNFEDGGDNSQGRELNPITNEPYLEQIVPRADYARVLAEFWADGPDSETPPGHWFTILNYVNDHPSLEKKFNGRGTVLDDIEWDVKSYFTLGGAMHDAAVASWGIKGYYDYVRPRTAIRYMGDKGQSSNPELPRYSKEGLQLIGGLIKMNGQRTITLIKAWNGAAIKDYRTDVGGVTWINSNSWRPFQRPDFVTPPFAGYISGHSTFSRAAAEVMTLLTGSEYFPGGLGEFYAPKNEFLVAEDGPSVDVTLQWATYRDAADQCSLSRIWGGIHPPADDIPGRKIGAKIGIQAFELATKYFEGEKVEPIYSDEFIMFPNPADNFIYLNIPVDESYHIRLIDSSGKVVFSDSKSLPEYVMDVSRYKSGFYFIELKSSSLLKRWRVYKK